MIECPACGSHIDEGSKVCPECGADVMGATASFPVVGEESSASSGALESAEGPLLVVCKGPEVGERFYLESSRLTIGRDPDSDIFLNDVTVSRNHAVLEVADGSVTIRDSGSLNGTYVNGVLVDAAVLSSGDTVRVGTFQMVFADVAGD